MRKMIVVITLGLFSVAAFADPCMDANVTSLGYAADESADEIYPAEHGC